MEDAASSMTGGKRVFSFWIVWPHDLKTSNGSNIKSNPHGVDKDADDSDDDEATTKEGVKGLKEILAHEKSEKRQQQEQIEKDIESYRQHDQTVRNSVRVAGAGIAAGVVIGVLTAGIGLIPYVAAVGVAAAAGGGALVYPYTKPSEYRLILAADSMDGALAWKTALENHIATLESGLKPMLPATSNPQVISSIIDMSTEGGGWRLLTSREGVRILEQTHPVEGTLCHKAQVTVHCDVVNTFLVLMENHYWPRYGSFHVSTFDLFLILHSRDIVLIVYRWRNNMMTTQIYYE